ncbi:MAG: methyltransferase domain-containing protein [Deltaproteobacteria bacterium]|nr:methyltransferase domain-containing protein [Candidatus Anaeroferrophillus wilburensis]MBN2889867.1 methyltransferase domain-containing protein [Deltaproteobacteria bacterium]
MDFKLKLRQSLRQMYDAAARQPLGLLGGVSPARGIALLEELGYATEDLQPLPDFQIGTSFPCGNPLPVIRNLQPSVVFDLGCGSGLDLCILAGDRQLNPALLGLDLSWELLSLARRARELLQLATTIQLVHADFSHLPYHHAFIDLISMNGSFNIIVDKASFFHDIASLLVPGGHLLIHDLLLVGDLPAGFADEVTNWSWNIGGAISDGELLRLATKASLSLVHLYKRELVEPVCRGEILLQKGTNSSSKMVPPGNRWQRQQ